MVPFPGSGLQLEPNKLHGHLSVQRKPWTPLHGHHTSTSSHGGDVNYDLVHLGVTVAISCRYNGRKLGKGFCLYGFGLVQQLR